MCRCCRTHATRYSVTDGDAPPPFALLHISSTNRLLNASVAMRAAERATWSGLTDSLLKREAFLTQLAACSRPGSGCAHLATCYPCHCSMLSKVAQAKVADRDFVLAMRQECGGFIATLDMKAYVMK